jgi:serine protease inhibitor
MKTFLLGVCAVLVLLSSCTKTPEITDNSEIFRQKLLQANNAFSIKVLQQTQLANDSANVVVAPISLSVGLSIMANGAEGTTRDAMINALEMQGLSLADVNQTYKALIDELSQQDPAVEISVMNSVWMRNGLNVKTVFEQINQLYYQIGLQQLDFNSPDAIQIINNWVSNATGGNIQQIIDQLADGQGMYLINSLWFNARFKQAFDSTLTTQQPFYVTYGQTIPVTMMSGRGMQYGFYGDNEVNIADLPYENGAFSLTVLMPSDGRTLNQLIASLSLPRWDAWMNGLRYDASPNLFLPKFNVEYSSYLKPLFTSMGMGVAFEDNADFSNFCDVALSIADLKHKTALAITEQGTMQPNNSFVASNTLSINKPFIVAVRHKTTGRVLLIGKVMNPAL